MAAEKPLAILTNICYSVTIGSDLAAGMVADMRFSCPAVSSQDQAQEMVFISTSLSRYPIERSRQQYSRAWESVVVHRLVFSEN